MKRGKFSLSHYKLFSCDMGELIPCGLVEVLPGDTFQHATSLLVRASPLLAPVMHPVHVRIHHWYVPMRLLWSEWENFITGGPDGLNASVFPTRTINPSVGTLSDYLGITPGATSTVSALPYRAYAKIFNEFYRDEDLVTPLVVSTASGVDSTTNTTLQRVAWEKDYFTSSRPWEQKGPTITIPLGTTAPVIYNTPTGAAPIARNSATGTPFATGAGVLTDAGTGQLQVSSQGALIDPNGTLATDLTGASAVTMTILRQAAALQRMEEARARYGSRYSEYLRYLGVRSSDARLQRPEYLGGGRQTIQFSEVLQTAADGANPVGTLRGHGISAIRSNRYRRFFEEHGYVMSLMSVIPKTIYAQGLERTFNRRTKEDFWQKELQHIGQQQVLNKEVYAAHTSPNGVFGYQDRYDEYRRHPSNIAAEFRTTLNFWHEARIFSSDPALNASFVTSTPSERIFATPATDNLYIMARHSIQARRLVAQTGSSYLK